MKELDQGEVFVVQNFMHLKHAFVLLQVQKRNFIENIIPIIISLKAVLEKNKIPALRELMNYLRVKDKFVLCGWCLPAPQFITQDLLAIMMVWFSVND